MSDHNANVPESTPGAGPWGQSRGRPFPPSTDYWSAVGGSDEADDMPFESPAVEGAKEQHRHRQLLPVAGAAVALALAAGSVGYIIAADQVSAPTGSSRGVTSSPFGGPNAQSSPNSPFTFPNSGQLPQGQSSPFSFPNNGQFSQGQSSSAAVPKAVSSSERALVDVNTTIGNGQASGAATGIVLTSGGLVLTNNHVIEGTTSISAIDLGNGQTYAAKVVGYDVRDDVAVIQLQGASGLATASFASASLGETVYAVGNAGGTGGTPTVTSGAVSSLSQSVTASDDLNSSTETLTGMLQTSAALISGDSGGALTTSSGQVVGVDTIGSSGATGTGGYAIPISRALSIAHAIEAGKTAARIHVGPTAMLGVEINTNQATGGGALVSSSASGTPAASAGISAGSRVTSVGGINVASTPSLRLVMTEFTPGQRVRVTWTTPAGARHAATVVLASGPPQ